MNSPDTCEADPANGKGNRSSKTSITPPAELLSTSCANLFEEQKEVAESELTETMERRSNHSNRSFGGEEENPDQAIGESDQLRRICENLEAEIVELKSSLDNETEARTIAEDTIDLRQEELEKQEAENARLREENVRLQEEVRGAGTERIELERQLKESVRNEKEASQQLNDARDHIFRLQPRRRSITETEAQESFQKLFETVQRWVQNRLEPILDELDNKQLRNRQCPADIASKLLALTSERARKYFTSHESDEYHVIAAIMQYLCQTFFNRGFYCPLDDGLGENDKAAEFIEGVESAMRRLPRDLVQCREWRSETLTALVSQPEFESRRSSYGTYRTEELARILAVLVPMADVQKLRESIWKSMIKPAMDLAHDLQVATDVFSVRWTPLNAVDSDNINEKRQDFGEFACVNLLDYGKPLRLPGGQAAHGRLRISYLFDMCPGLYCQSVRNDALSASRTLCRPVVLVVASEGNQKLPAKGPTLLQWLSDGINKQGRR